MSGFARPKGAEHWQRRNSWRDGLAGSLGRVATGRAQPVSRRMRPKPRVPSKGPSLRHGRAARPRCAARPARPARPVWGPGPARGPGFGDLAGCQARAPVSSPSPRASACFRALLAAPALHSLPQIWNSHAPLRPAPPLRPPRPSCRFASQNGSDCLSRAPFWPPLLSQQRLRSPSAECTSVRFSVVLVSFGCGQRALVS